MSEPIESLIPLRAGPLSLFFQAGDLRYVRLGEREALRRVAVVVRDDHWGTLTNRLANLVVESDTDRFRITYDAVSAEGAVDFGWHAQITGDAYGTITFAFDGQARTSFWTNRLGLVVLHPIRECAGAACRVEHPDGSFTESAFPLWVSPAHPFEEIQALTHPVQAGVAACVRFAGEIFETEDQRNWTDASFKTYSTPVRLGFPREVPDGTRLAQTMTLSLVGSPPPIVAESPATPMLSVGAQPVGPLPQFGLGLASHGQPLSPGEVERLRALGLSHLRADLRLADADWLAMLRRAAAEAEALGVRLELALHLPADPASALETLRATLAGRSLPIVTWLLYGAAGATLTPAALADVRRRLAPVAPAARWVAGTNAYFVDLNTRRPAVDGLDGVCYPINPQGHATDTLSMMETFEAQASTVLSARQFAPGCPVYISPLTLRPRFNVHLTGAELPQPDVLPFAVDARQMRLEAAAWTVGSLAALAGTGGVAGVTLYETTGWRGVMETEAGSPLPQLFPSQPGQVFPVYHVLADLAGAQSAEVLPATSTQPLSAAALAWRSNGKVSALVANLTHRPQRVRVTGLGARSRVRYLDAISLPPATLTPETYRTESSSLVVAENEALTLMLDPYAVARLIAE